MDSLQVLDGFRNFGWTIHKVEPGTYALIGPDPSDATGALRVPLSPEVDEYDELMAAAEAHLTTLNFMLPEPDVAPAVLPGLDMFLEDARQEITRAWLHSATMQPSELRLLELAEGLLRLLDSEQPGAYRP